MRHNTEQMQEQTPVTRPPVGQRIGAGWLGVIYTAGTDVDGQPLALRALSLERLTDVGQLAQLMTLAASATHPNILPVSPPQADEQGAYYLMPQATGGSLRGVFERYRAAGMTLDVETMLDVLRQITEGLDFAHSRGLLHGNVKPENILLLPLPAPQQDEYRLLLSDFGLNALRPADPHSPYLPGPQRSGAAATLESDLYALGAVAFEGLTGRPLPLKPQPSDLAELPEAAARIVARCVGLSTPFTDIVALNGYLKALNLSAHQSSGVTLSTDPPVLDVVPGETQELRVRVHSGEAQPIQLILEGLPADWATPTATLNLGAGQEAVVSLRVSPPRQHDVRVGIHDTRLVALTPATDPSGRPVNLEIGRLALPVRVQPFTETTLQLTNLGGLTRSTATLTALLRNEGNQTQRYNLEITVPDGGEVRHGAARRQMELAPGAEYRDTLEVRLPTPGLSSRTLTIAAQAHSLARPTPAEMNGEEPTESWPPLYNTVQHHLQLQQLPLVPWWGLALAAAGLVGAGVWATRPPQIEWFSLKGEAPLPGEPFTLAWKTQGARQVRIEELSSQKLDTNGEVQVSGLNGTRTYTLIARGLFTQQRQQITVTPDLPQPRIQTFKATPSAALLGEKVTVSWQVQNASDVTLQPFGAVPPSGSREFIMQRSTALTLSARQPTRLNRPPLTSTLKVALAPAQIKQFKITPPSALRGEAVTLSWQVSGAKAVRLNPLGTLPTSGSRTIQATQTTNFTLKASNGQQETTASANLNVRIPQAQIEALTITPRQPVIGQPVRVQWRSRNAQSAELRWGNQQQTVAPSGDLTFTATAATSAVTLVAKNANGEPAMQTQRLQLRQPSPRATTTPKTVKTPHPSVTIPSPAPATTRPAPTTPRPPVTSTRPPAPTSRPDTTATAPKPAATNTSVPGRPVQGQDVQVRAFKFTPTSARTPSQGTLAWRVTGTKTVRIQGLNGPGSVLAVPTSGTLRITPSRQNRTLTLQAGSKKATLSIPAAPTPRNTPEPNQSQFIPAEPTTSSRKAPTPARPVLPRPTVQTRPGSSQPYPAIEGEWNHSFGVLSLKVSGNRVTGNLQSSRSDLPSGPLTGRLSGSADSLTLNGFIGSSGNRVAVVLQFSPSASTFTGLYASRTSRVPWCGWRGSAAKPCR